MKSNLVLSAAAVAVISAGAVDGFVVRSTTKTPTPPPARRSFVDRPQRSSDVVGASSGASNDEGGASDDDDAEASSSSSYAGFESLGLNADLLRSARACGWDVPTPIQRLAVKPILDLAFGKRGGGGGSDDESESESESDDEDESYDSIWCEAPTGSGKTACFALPLTQALVRERRDRLQRGESLDGKVSCLVLCPTRELAAQIGGVLRDVNDAMPEGRGLSRDDDENGGVMTIHGGVPIDPQVEALARRKKSGRGLEVLVATPGRLADVLTRGRKEDQAEAALERNLLRALDATGRTDASLSLAAIEEMEFDPNDDGGRSDIEDMLDGVRYLVLDEADRLLGQPFKGEMDGVLELLPVAKEADGFDDDDDDDGEEEDEDGRSGKKMKTLLFSATFPEQILPRVESVLHQLSGSGKPPLRLSAALAGQLDTEEEGELSHRQQKRLARTTQAASVVEGPASTISLRTIRLEEPRRTMALRRLLEQNDGSAGGGENEKWDRVLVFVSTRYSSEHVSRKLRRAGIKSAELHGKLDQDARQRRLDDFKRGKIRVLVATDLASRGLDVAGLPAVVNYDLPRSTADFTHRIGRTGRAGKKGTAVTFVTPSSECQFDLIEKRHFAGGTMGVEREILAGFEPDEDEWMVKAEAARLGNPGAEHSERGLAHDRMFGGVKGRRKSKKDKLRERAARERAGGKKKKQKQK